MSAYIISDKHLDTVLSYIQARRLGMRQINEYTDERMSELGQMFWNENFKAVNERYSENEQPWIYQFRKVKVDISAVQFMKLLQCIEHQCSAAKEWQKTEAYDFIVRILFSTLQYLPDYDAANWDL